MIHSTVITQTLEVGDLYIVKTKARLDQLGLSYTCERGFRDTTITIKTSCPSEKVSLKKFMVEVNQKLQELKELDERFEQEAIEWENRQKLEKINRWRRITFRKPLETLKYTTRKGSK